MSGWAGSEGPNSVVMYALRSLTTTSSYERLEDGGRWLLMDCSKMVVAGCYWIEMIVNWMTPRFLGTISVDCGDSVTMILNQGSVNRGFQTVVRDCRLGMGQNEVKRM